MKKLFFVITILLVSCRYDRIEYEYKYQIVKAKTIDIKDGTTRYNIAFTDGDSKPFNFGTYIKYNIGDTIRWEREKGWFWYIVDK